MKSKVLTAIALLAVMAVSCTAAPKYAPGAGPGPYGGPAPDNAIWFASDSLAHHTARHMPHEPFWATAIGASGFTDNPAHLNGQVLQNVLDWGVADHKPDLVLAMGGANDLSALESPVSIIAAMEEFEATLAGFGVPVRWILEPTWGHAAGYQPIYDHLIANKPDAIDCRWEAGQSLDGIHPSNYQWFAYCIDAAVHG